MVHTNKPNLYYLYIKPKPSYKGLENRGKDMKPLDLFKSQFETTTAYVLFITNHNVKLN